MQSSNNPFNHPISYGSWLAQMSTESGRKNMLEDLQQKLKQYFEAILVDYSLYQKSPKQLNDIFRISCNPYEMFLGKDVIVNIVNKYSGNAEQFFTDIGVDLSNPNIQCGLGYIYENGVPLYLPSYGIPNTSSNPPERTPDGYIINKNEQKALEWYGKASPYNETAKIRLGEFYYELAKGYRSGIGRTKDEKLAYDYYSKGAEQGNSSAQNDLGYCLEHGIGTEKNEVLAFASYEQAAVKSFPVALYNLGRCLEYGIGIVRDDKQAMLMYELSSIHNYSDAHFKIGECNEKGLLGREKDEKNAVVFYERSAKQKNIKAYVSLGNCYLNGIGVTKDEKIGFDWIYKAAVNESARDAFSDSIAEAQYMMGVFNENGQYTSVNKKDAVKWYQKAAEGDNNAAKASLAVCYLEGRYLPKDAMAASVWCKKINFEPVSKTKESKEPWVGLLLLYAFINYSHSQNSYTKVLNDLRNNQNLQEIDLSYTVMDAKQTHEIIEAIPAKNEITRLSLKYTFLNVNDIKKITLKLPNLTEIHLNGNKLHGFDLSECIAHLSKLKIVNLSDNKIYNLDSVLKSLKNSKNTCISINLSYNVIGYLYSYLFCSGSYFGDISLDDLKQIKTLDLSFNEIKKIDINETLKNLPKTSLTNLVLEKNEIKLEDLKKLDQYFKKASNPQAVGDSHYKKKEYKSAEIWYKKALELEPKNDQFEYRLFCTLYDLKKYEEALLSINKVIKKNAWINYTYDQARTLLKLNRYDEALASLDLYLRKKPEDLKALFRKAETLLKLAKPRPKDALRCYDKILKIQPDNYACFEGKISCYRRMGKLINALVCVEYLLGININTKENLNVKANILCAMFIFDSYFERFMNEYPVIVKNDLGIEPNTFINILEYINYLDFAFFNDFQIDYKLESLSTLIEKHGSLAKTCYREKLNGVDNIYNGQELNLQQSDFQKMITTKQQRYLSYLTLAIKKLNEEIAKTHQNNNISPESIEIAKLCLANNILKLKKEFIEVREEYERAEKNNYDMNSRYESNRSQLLSCQSDYKQSVKNYNYQISSEFQVSRSAKDHALNELNSCKDIAVSQIDTTCDSAISKQKAETKAFVLKSKNTWKQFLFESISEIKNKLDSLILTTQPNLDSKEVPSYVPNEDDTKSNDIYEAKQDIPKNVPIADKELKASDIEYLKANNSNHCEDMKPTVLESTQASQPSLSQIQINADTKVLITALQSNQLKKVSRVLNNLHPDVNYYLDEFNIGKSMWTSLHLACSLGNADSVKLLVEFGANLDAEDMDGNKPLMIATINNHLEVITMLVSLGASVNDENDAGQTPLQIASHNANTSIIQALTQLKADTNVINNDDKPSDKSNELNQNEEKLSANQNVSDYKHSAAEFKLFNCNSNDVINKTIQAIKNKDEKSTKNLLNQIDDINIDIGKWDTMRKGWTLLHLACECNAYDIITLMMMNNPDIDIKNAEGNTPLHVAISLNHESIVELLLEFGANANIKSDKGKTAQELAIDKGYVAISLLLTKHVENTASWLNKNLL